MNIKQCNNTKFKAKTIINSNNTLLSKEEIKSLTKIGKKIGTKSDKINFNVRTINNDIVTISHNAKFYSGQHSIETSNIKYSKIDEINPFEYISKKLNTIKELYKHSQ